MAFRFPVRKENDEVYYSEESFVLIGPEDLVELKKIAAVNTRQRARLCVHPSPSAALHEMFIVHGRDAYVRPHRHLGRQEGFMVLEGTADLLIFSSDGKLTQVVSMDLNCFYKRLKDPIYHMLRIRSDFLVFYEATSGPFNRCDTVFAPWSPDEVDELKVKIFLSDIDALVQQFGG